MSIDVRAEFASLLRRHGLLGGDLLVALSGGLDSVCLLRLLVEVQRQLGGRLEVAHVDHALRADSAADAGFCRSLSRELGCPFHLRRLGPGAWGGGGGRQAEARRARRRFFEEVAGRRGLATIALGHQADDQVETVLYRLARGAGLRGLAGMEEFSPPYVRPLLHLGRVRLQSLAESNGWAHREDPSNDTDRYARNRLRHQVLPTLARVHPGAAAGVLRFARLAAEDDQLLTRLAHDALEEWTTREPEGVRLPVVALAALEAPLRRRIYLALWRLLGWPAGRLQAHHLEAVDALLQPGRAHRFAATPGPGRFAVSYDQLWLLRPACCSGVQARAQLTGPDGTGLSTCHGVVRWGESLPTGRDGVGLPAGARRAVWVRGRRPGDRVPRPGRSARKLKDLLIAARMPLWRRAGVLVVEDGGRVLGALGRGFTCGGTQPDGGWLWLDPHAGGAEEP